MSHKSVTAFTIQYSGNQCDSNMKKHAGKSFEGTLAILAMFCTKPRYVIVVKAQKTIW